MDVHPGSKKFRGPEYKRAELDPIRRALEENEDWYQDLVEHSQDLLCIHDLQGRLLSVNPAPARVLGYSVEELLQIPMREIVVPEFLPQFDAYLKQIARTGMAHGFLAVRTRSGEQRIWEYHNTLRTEGVALPIVRGVAHDVTEQKRTEKLLREAGEELLRRVREGERTIAELKLFRTLLDKSNDAIEVVDPETLRFLDVNEKACSDLGYSREELLSLRVFDTDPNMTEASIIPIREHWRRPGWLVLESVHRRKDGSTFPVELSTKQVHVDRDYVVAVARDLTERKVAEARLTASETRYRAVHDRAPVGICRVEVGTGRFLGVNPKYCEIVGRTEEDLLGRTFLSITHPDDLMQGQQNLRQVADVRKRHCEIEKRYVRPDGSVRWVELEVVTMGREDAEPDSYLAIVQDITERRQSGESLREYERVVEGLEEMIAVVDRNYRYVIANRAFLEYRGLRKDQVVGRFVSDIIGQAAFVDRVKEKMDECFLGKVVQYQLIYDFPKLGRKELCASYFPIEGRTGVDRLAMIVRDITEQKQAEQARRKAEENLQKSESRLRLALDGSPIKVFNQDRELRYTWVYNLQEGWSEEDYLGKTDEEIFGPENAAKMLAIKRPVLETGRGTRQEFTLKARGKIYYCDITVEPLVDAAGQVVGVNCACVDITQLREIMEELRLAKEKLAEEKLYLEESIDSELGFGEIIGRSSALKVVMQKVAKVAPSDATVLLLGETGTGKELVARALHRLSNRQGNSFIKMNCAAIPSGLLESELFGHEKGAFTGAVARKVGRLELADKGTLFLDEIGEVPLSLQPKLLRVLQDQEFERLGSTQTLKVNFRLLAATNRDLLQSVKAREFRSDLYYRLNVFPIVIPPLRERREDIRPLIEHFVRKFAMQMKKSVASIPSKTMETLVRWEWPGNIRELENFVERSVILTPGSVLQSPLSELEAEIDKVNGPHNDGLRAVERERILRALHDCHGKLGGADGAAARLGLKRTTLQSKLDHLGIKPESYRA